MKIGIVFTQEKEIGGVYQYALSLLQTLLESQQNIKVVVFNTSKDFPEEFISHPNIEFIDLFEDKAVCKGQEKKTTSSIVFVVKKMINQILFKLRLHFILNIFFSFKEKNMIQILKKSNVDLLFFSTTDSRSFLTGIPFVEPIHDLAHIFCPQFPEVSSNGVRQMRDYTFSQVACNAYRILADSEIGKNDIARYYNIKSDKIVVLPLVPPNYLQDDFDSAELLSIKQKFNLPKKFLFYPAQFWPHKNHINIVKAIQQLKEEGIIINIVFSGGKKEEYGEYAKVFHYIEHNGLSQQVYYVGYVDNVTISALYKLAYALIMPTFFGPTNIPILEAWKMGCPVIYSGIRGCREQAGDAALLVEPSDYYDIAKKIKILWLDDDLRLKLIKNGEERVKLWSYFDFRNSIFKIIKDFKLDYPKIN